MRGGISYIAKRHIKANNKYMKCYGNANNLCGWVNSQYLPYSGFK